METLIRKPRRKWKFKDRESAELAAEDRSIQLSRMDAVVNGIVRGEVVWGKRKWGDESGTYRFGWLGRRNETIFLYVWEARNKGQKPSVTVLGESEARKLIEKLCADYGMDKLGREFREGIQACWQEAMRAVA